MKSKINKLVLLAAVANKVFAQNGSSSHLDINQAQHGTYMDGEDMIEDHHSCLRPVCGDDVPMIGQTKLTNLYINAGHGSKGWTYSWGSAVLLAQVIHYMQYHPGCHSPGILGHVWGVHHHQQGQIRS